MIVLAGTMTFDAVDIAEFSAGVRDLVGRVRGEDGCTHYSLLVEDVAAGLVNVTEIWRDDAALRAHMAQPWTAAFFARFGPKAKDISVLVYDVSDARRLADVLLV